MTISAERAPGSAVAKRQSREPSSRDVPVRARGVVLIGEAEGSGYEQAPALVRRADGQNLQLTPLLFHVLAAIDGKRGYEELAEVIGELTDRAATADDARFLVEEKLRPLGVLQAEDGNEPAPERSSPLLALSLKYVVSDPAVTRRIAAPFAVLYHPVIVLSVVAAFAFVTGWILFEKGLASALHQAMYEPRFLLLVLGLTFLSAGFHELGHAAACKYSGAAPGAMGVGIYLVWPAFYTDVSDSYRLDRRSRLRVDLGGLYFNAIFAVATVALSVLVGWDALLLVVAAQLFQMVRQLVPVVRFDGYHVLADLVGVPDLFRHLKPTLLSAIGRAREETVRLKPWARAVVTLWVAAVVPVLAAMLVFAVLILPRLLATAADSLRIRWDEVAAGWAANDVAAVTTAVLSMALVALPAVGIPYILGRTGWRVGAWALRSTSGRPPLRAATVLGAAAVLAGVVWAWWPQDQYRPIEPTERWALVSSVSGMAGSPSLPLTGDAEPKRALMVALMTTREDGSTGIVVLAPGLEPPDDMPVLGEDVPIATTPTETTTAPEETPATSEPTPTTSTAAPTTTQPSSSQEWPFPFERPRQAQEGDNQVVVVNTKDGSIRYAHSFKLVWVTGGEPVDQWNEAWALASCTNCKTVAIAFQVVLGVGSSPIVTPVNTAVAVNNECTSCVTHALAMQLVQTLMEAPSEETLAELQAAWAALVKASEQFVKLPLTEVRAQLEAARTQIEQILANDADGDEDEKGETTTGTTTTSTSPATTTGTTTTTTTTAPTPTPTTSTPTTTTSTEPPPQAPPPTGTTTSTTTTTTPTVP
jgi:putative peptide zinc metalloprotease protein